MRKDSARRFAKMWNRGWLRPSIFRMTWRRRSGLADTRAGGALNAFLSWRCDVVTSLVGEIKNAIRKDAAFAIIPSVARPTAGCWYEGSDLPALAKTAGIIEACFYEPSAERVRVDAWDVKRRVGDAGKLRGILRPAHPDLEKPRRSGRGGGGAARHRHHRRRLLQLRPCAQAEQRRLDRRRARSSRRLERGVQGQGRRDHGRLWRHRPRALPLSSGRKARPSRLSTSVLRSPHSPTSCATLDIKAEAAVVDIGDSERGRKRPSPPSADASAIQTS